MRADESVLEENNLLTKLRGINCVSAPSPRLHPRFFQRLTLHNWLFPYNWIPSGAIAANPTARTRAARFVASSAKCHQPLRESRVCNPGNMDRTL